MAPLEIALELSPRARLDILDARELAATAHGDALEGYAHCLYASPHTTAGYLPQNLAVRLSAKRPGIEPYLELFKTFFPPNAGYQHDNLELRTELPPDQRSIEPINGDSHLAFMAAGLRACVSYHTRRPGPVYFIDLDGLNVNTPRKRVTTLVGYDHEEIVARTTMPVPVSPHPIEAVNLKDPRFGFSERLADLVAQYGVTKGRVRIELAAGEQNASLTINEYETLLMQHDVAEVLRNPLRFAAEKARHAWNDPRAVPGKAVEYAKYDLVRALNRLMDTLGLSASRVERLLAKAVELPASRFLRMKRSVDLLVSDTRTPGRGQVVEGTFQAPIMIHWRPAPGGTRTLNVMLTRFR